MRSNFRKRVAHHRSEVIDQFVEKRLFLPELVAVTHRTARNTPQHVAATGILGNHPVTDQKSTRANMVSDHAQARVGNVLLTRLAHACFDQGLEEINLVIRMHVLQYRAQTLQAHARIYRGFGQGNHRAIRDFAVVLHEHQIPDFDKPVAIFIRATGRTARDMRSVVVEQFGTRPAGPRVAHHPEIVRGVLGALVVADAHDALFGHTHFVGPNVVGLFIVCIDGHPQLFCRQFVGDGEQFPSVLDRVALEIVAKRKIAEHFEKRVVPRRVADVLKVVVFAACAHAALRCDGADVVALFIAEKHVLELVHARIGEQQRWIVVRHQRRRCEVGMPLRLKKLDERLSNFGDGGNASV